MNFELISYTEYPDDQWTKAIVEVCIDGKYNIAYGKKVKKDGAVMWKPASHNVTKDGVKEYIDGFKLDSNKLDTQLDDFIRQSAKTAQYNTVKASQNPSISVSEDSMPPPF